LAGVDDHDALPVLDRPGISRQPFGPNAVGENGKLSAKTESAALSLRGFYFNGAGLDGIEGSSSMAP
jgi:hypothetical protein